MDKNEIKTVGIGMLLFTGVIFLFALSYFFYFYGGQTHEFCHYAEIASNVLNHQGFTTTIFYPAELAYLEKSGFASGWQAPVVFRFPLYTYWSAFWMWLSQSNDFGMALGNGVAHAIWVVLIFIFGQRLYNRKVAVLASCLWSVHPIMLAGYDLYGHSDVLFGSIFGIFAFSWWHLIEKDNIHNLKPAFFSGLWAGLAFLSRESFILWLPSVVLLPFILRTKKKGIPLVGFFLGFLVFYIPRAVYNVTHFGAISSPLSLWALMDGTVVKHMPWLDYRLFSLSELLNPAAVWALMKKGYFYFNFHLRDIPQLWMQFILFPFAILGLISSAKKESGFGFWIFSLFFWQTFVFSFLRYEKLGFLDGRYFLWFAPFVLLWASSYLMKIASTKLGKIILICILGTQLQYWAMIYASIRRLPDHSSLLPIRDWPEVSFIRDHIPPEARVATNIPGQLAWYGNHPTVYLPNFTEDLDRMNKNWDIPFVYISTHRLGEPENYPRWFLPNGSILPTIPAILEGYGYRLIREFPEGQLYSK